MGEALAAKAQHPDATPIVGGTGVMVENNMDHRRSTTLLDPPDILPNEGESLD